MATPANTAETQRPEGRLPQVRPRRTTGDGIEKIAIVVQRQTGSHKPPTGRVVRIVERPVNLVLNQLVPLFAPGRQRRGHDLTTGVDDGAAIGGRSGLAAHHLRRIGEAGKRLGIQNQEIRVGGTDLGRVRRAKHFSNGQAVIYHVGNPPDLIHRAVPLPVEAREQKAPHSGGMCLHSHPDLPKVVLQTAERPASRDRVDCRQQHRNQRADNADDNQQFDEREAVSPR